MTHKEAYERGFMYKIAEYGLAKLAECGMRFEKRAALGGLGRTMSALRHILSNRRSRRLSAFFGNNAPPLVTQATTQSKSPPPVLRMKLRRPEEYKWRETYDEMQSLLGPKMTAGEFMEANPYNDFTVFKGDVRRPFIHFDMPARPDDLWFMSARPTVALDYHWRPLSNDTSMTRMLATGDLRRSPTFLEGDRFLSPQSASVNIKDQIRAAMRGRGTQQYYRTGYHNSSDFKDFEIPLPRPELENIFDRYYLPTQTRDIGFQPFGHFAEAYPTKESFSRLPFSFQQVSDPTRFAELSARLKAEGGIPLDRKAGGLLPYTPPPPFPSQVPSGRGYTAPPGQRKVTITDVPLPSPIKAQSSKARSGPGPAWIAWTSRSSANNAGGATLGQTLSPKNMPVQSFLVPQLPPRTAGIAATAGVPFGTAQGLSIQRFLSNLAMRPAFTNSAFTIGGGPPIPIRNLPNFLDAISKGHFPNPPPSADRVAWAKKIIDQLDQLANFTGLVWVPPKVV